MIVSWICSGERPARSVAGRAARPTTSAAGTDATAPPKLPNLGPPAASRLAAEPARRLYARAEVVGSAPLSWPARPAGFLSLYHPSPWAGPSRTPRDRPPRDPSHICTVSLPATIQRLTPADSRAWA